MVQAIVDPEDLRMFASELRRLNDEVHDRMIALKGLFAALGETWRDQEQAKFAEEFDRTLTVLESFHTSADKHFPFLLGKAEAAQEYLDRS